MPLYLQCTDLRIEEGGCEMDEFYPALGRLHLTHPLMQTQTPPKDMLTDIGSELPRPIF